MKNIFFMKKKKKYPILPEFQKHEKDSVPLHPLVLKVVNLLMPIVQRANSPYEKELTIKTISFSDFTAQLIRPKEAKAVPCLVYFHGGAFVLKASKSHKNRVREYAYRGNMAVLFVDYRLAPKYKFPIPVQDCYEAYLWALRQFEGEKIYIGGDSAGGNLALAVIQKAVEEKKKIPDKLMLLYPVTDTRMTTESMKKYTDTPVWNAKLNARIWDMYVEREKLHHSQVSPAEAEDFSYFPECYIETAEFDCLRDEGIQFARQLEADRVTVQLENTKGTIHGYDVEEKSEYVRSFIEKRIAFLKLGVVIIFSLNILSACGQKGTEITRQGAQEQEVEEMASVESRTIQKEWRAVLE